ncbi:MAG: DUF5606 domain-containing protein [Flavobacteriaceae bacterium]
MSKDLETIISIAGYPGLYKLLAQTKGGFVAESLIDQKRVTVPLRAKVSMLSEIAVYTLEKELPLKEVFDLISAKESGMPSAVSPKADKIDLEAYFFEILPSYDEERVYASDIKKIISWYNLLSQRGLLSTKTEADQAEKG